MPNAQRLKRPKMDIDALYLYIEKETMPKLPHWLLKLMPKFFIANY
ncbi:hypothetical protein NIES4106_60880 (plasmid) [Fischerella sp. NIES-4106]|nr:hypothetical protein NIES4106_60880 [Fischerella sp. NIES-4106]